RLRQEDDPVHQLQSRQSFRAGRAPKQLPQRLLRGWSNLPEFTRSSISFCASGFSETFIGAPYSHEHCSCGCPSLSSIIFAGCTDAATPIRSYYASREMQLPKDPAGRIYVRFPSILVRPISTHSSSILG